MGFFNVGYHCQLELCLACVQGLLLSAGWEYSVPSFVGRLFVCTLFYDVRVIEVFRGGNLRLIRPWVEELKIYIC